MQQKQKDETVSGHSRGQTRKQAKKKLKKLGKAAAGTLVAGSLMAGTLFAPVDDHTALAPEQPTPTTSVVAVLEQPSAPDPAEEEKRRAQQTKAPLGIWQRIGKLPLGVRIAVAAAVWLALHMAVSTLGSAAIVAVGPVLGALAGLALTTAAVGGAAAVTAKMIAPDRPLKESFRPGRLLAFAATALILAITEQLALCWLPERAKAAAVWGGMVLETILLVFLGAKLYLRAFCDHTHQK